MPGKPETYRVTLSDGNTFDVTTEGGPPSEADVMSQLGIKPQAKAPIASGTAQIPRSAGERFASGVGEMLNPVTVAEGAYNAFVHPYDTAKTMIGAQVAQGQKAAENFQQGRYSEALGHGAAAVMPLVGPAAADIGEQIGGGDVAGGLGRATGLVAPMVGPAIAGAVGRGARAVVPSMVREAIAAPLERAAASQVADVMSPKIGANKTRFGNMAAKVAPDIAADPKMAAWSRQGLQDKLAAKFEDTQQGLDTVSDARLSARSFPIAPIVQELKGKIGNLTAQAVDASNLERTPVVRQSAILDESGKPIHVTDLKAEPVGTDVVPEDNRARVAKIQNAINELQQLGPMAPYESLRRIRASYDIPAKAVYNPAMTPDFMKVQGEKYGAADVTGVMRDNLAKFDPETAKANAPYALYKSANDVMKATEEVERVRPKVGRQIMARLTYGAVGEMAGGLPGLVAGVVLGPTMDSLLASGWTTQLKTARLYSNLATAIRSGNDTQAYSIMQRIKHAAPQAALLSEQEQK